MKEPAQQQKTPYQTPKLEPVGAYVALIATSVVTVPIQFDGPRDGEQ